MTGWGCCPHTDAMTYTIPTDPAYTDTVLYSDEHTTVHRVTTSSGTAYHVYHDGGRAQVYSGPWLHEITDPVHLSNYGLVRAWAQFTLFDGRTEGAALGLDDDLLYCEDGDGDCCTFPADRWADALAWLAARVR